MRACGSGFTWFDSAFEAKQELARIGEEKGWKRVIIRRRYYGDLAKETMPFIDGSVIYAYEANEDCHKKELEEFQEDFDKKKEETS